MKRRSHLLVMNNKKSLTFTAVLLFRCGCDLAAKRSGSETNAHYSFLNIITFHSQFYIILSTNLV